MIVKGIIMNSVELHVGSSLPFWAFLLILIAGTMIGVGVGYAYDVISDDIYSHGAVICGLIMFVITGVAIIIMANPSHEENIQTFERAYGMDSAAFIPVDDKTPEFTWAIANGSCVRNNYTYVANGGRHNVSVIIDNGKMTMVSDGGVVKPDGKGIR